MSDTENRSVNSVLNKLEKIAGREISRKQYETALQAISISASLLYRSNLKYCDDKLERCLRKIAEGMELCNGFTAARSNDTLIFFDGFGLENRGLALIYLKAISRIKKIEYITYSDRRDSIPAITEICRTCGHRMHFIERKEASETNKIKAINAIVRSSNARQFIFYSTPDDVAATTIMYAYEGILERIQINLTDHAFWLGKDAIDKCIEFRDYGASISKYYRRIPEEKINIIPFYPNIEYDVEFQGWPFSIREGQKVVFSGGALYKTVSEDNLYCRIVERILKENPDVVFWYAGSGDNPELMKLIDNYPGRAFFTSERNDLFRVLEHSHLYLSTYPMCGGLMFQYAAMAGIVPVTLKHGNISDDFLINQDEIGIEYTSLEEMFSEINRLLNDKEYWLERQSIMKNSVIKPEDFDKEVEKLLDNRGELSLKPSFKRINTEQFNQWYSSSVSEQTINDTLLRRNSIKFAIRFFPLRFGKAALEYIRRK